MKNNKLFGWIIAVIVVAGSIWGFWGTDIGPIEDINGPDDYSLKVKAKKCMKKDLMKLVFVSFTRSYFSNF